MTIDEAIKELQNEIDEHLSCGNLPYYNALQLSIEALKRIKDIRDNSDLPDGDLLLGETEE